MKRSLLLTFLCALLCLSLASAQEALQAIPLLESEPGAPNLYSSEVVGEGEARGRDGDVQKTRDYRSKLLIDGGTGDLVDVAWTFFQKPSGVVPTVSTEMTGNASSERFGYANGFLVGFLANVCFDISEGDLEALGTWYVATLEALSSAGRGEVAERFGAVNVSLELSQTANGASRMRQELWRDGVPGEGWSSFCTLEPLLQD